ncbi:MAG: DoxX family protein [Anaerolineales bacterium]|jgi:thiosulfate dehydrogenase [quinone] large subunit
MNIFNGRSNSTKSVKSIEDSPFARALFNDVRWAWIWLVPRLWLGWEWLKSGWGKLHNPAWTGTKAGTALAGFMQNALTKTAGAHPDVQTWYAWFLQHIVIPNATLWSYMVSWGEFLVGVALILGLFTGIVAIFGSFMNLNYLLAGSVSINPILFVPTIFLILAWKTAGWWGLDRWLLPALGTPWRPGYIFHVDHHKGDITQPLPHSTDLV